MRAVRLAARFIAIGLAAATITGAASAGHDAWLAATRASSGPATLTITATPGTASGDCLIRGGATANVSFCQLPLLTVGRDALKPNRSLLRFDLHGVPANAYVVSARIGLYLVARIGASAAVDVHELRTPFTSAATWNQSDKGKPWQSPGGDFDPTPVATATVGQPLATQWWTISDLGGLRAAIAGSSPNDGFLFKAHNETSPPFLTFSSSQGLAALRPKLELSYLVDATPPTISLSGTLVDHAAALDPSTTYTLAIAATDGTADAPQSGVAGVDVFVDGTRKRHVDQPCPQTSCPLSTTFAFDASAYAAGTHTVRVVAADQAGNQSSRSLTVTVGSNAPPVLNPPPLATSSPTSLADATSFLFEGSNPVQQGVAANTIDPVRQSVLHGTVVDASGQPLAGVTASIVGHPELGHMDSTADGQVYLAVNGGGALTVRYEKNGYLTVERPVNVPWGQYVDVDQVVMTQLDTHANAITSGAAADQVARGSVETDADGSRRATLIFPAATTAQMTMPDGTTQPLGHLTVRLTEYTVGPDGLSAMPAPLPPASRWTYAVDYSVDEAEAAGATGVTFSKPLAAYTENFLDFPVGSPVPSGYYDARTTSWVASDNGLVVGILGTANGLAQLDVDGSGAPADTATLAQLGIDDAELRQLASLYQPGTTLWRVPITHFTPYDFNWPGWGPENAEYPDQDGAKSDYPGDDSCDSSGSIVDCDNQILGEQVPIAGTPYALRYQSNTNSAYEASRTVTIPLTGDSPPSTLQSIDVDVCVDGACTKKTYSPAPDIVDTYVWDGKDAFGRTVQGGATGTIRIGYVYPLVYEQPSALAKGWSQIGQRGGANYGLDSQVRTITLTQDESFGVGEPLDVFDAKGLGFGGWMLNVLDSYDPTTHILHAGDGTRETGGQMQPAETTTAGGGTILPGGGGGSCGACAFRMHRTSKNSRTTTAAATTPGDGGPATDVALGYPTNLAVAPDGTLAILDNDIVRVVDPKGIITTLAGGAETGGGGGGAGAAAASSPGRRAILRAASPGDGGPATDVTLNAPKDIVYDPAGNLYIAELGASVIRKVTPDGTISTVAGTGVDGCSESLPADGTAALAADLCQPRELTFGPDGGLYFSAGTPPMRASIWELNPDGTLKLVLDGSNPSSPWYIGRLRMTSDGTLYALVSFNTMVAPAAVMSITPDGRVSFPSLPGPVDDFDLDADGNLIVMTAGEVARMLPSGDTVAIRSSLNGAQYTGMKVLPDGSVDVISRGADNRVDRIASALPGFVDAPINIGSPDGQSILAFDANGRQLQTRDAYTGAPVLTFGYDSQGLVTSITDGDGNVTRIERDGAGNPTAIVAPFGQRTQLTVDGSGYLSSITDPDGNSVHLTTSSDGLLQSFTDPNGDRSAFTYNSRGLLTSDTNAAGGSTTLVRDSSTQGGHTTTQTTALGRVTHHTVFTASAANGFFGAATATRTLLDPAGNTTTLHREGATTTLSSPDGTTTQTVAGDNPIFGSAVPYAASSSVTLPSGQSFAVSRSESVVGADPSQQIPFQSFTSSVTVDGNTTQTLFDALARMSTTTLPSGATITTQVDAQRRPTSVQVPGLDTWTATYDGNGRLTAEGLPGHQLQYGYSADGLVSTITDPLSQVSRFAYDAAGRLTKQTLPDGRSVSYRYDANGNVLSVVPSWMSATTYTYDDRNLMLSRSETFGGATTFAYDRDGAMTSLTRPSGTQLTFGYDSTGRSTTEMDAEGTTTFTYGTDNRVHSIARDNGTRIDYGYDGALPLSEKASGIVNGQVAHTFDESQHVASISINGAAPIPYRYDVDGQLTSAGDLEIGYVSGQGSVDSLGLGNTQTALQHDTIGELTSEQTTVGGAATLGLAYSYDVIGRLTSVAETSPSGTTTAAYAYDASGRLHQVTRDSSVAATYGYDTDGNRTSTTLADGSTVTAAYGAGDELTRFGTTTYTWNADGELASKTDSAGTTSYRYSPTGLLEHMALPDGQVIDYVYDPLGRRIATKVDGQLTGGLLYDGGMPVAQLGPDGSVVSQFVYGTSAVVPDYMIRGGHTYRIVTDQTASPRLVVDITTGEVVEQLAYDEWGNVVSDSNPGFQPFGYGGGLYDAATGLTHLGARDYDAQTGRFLEPDPLGLSGGDTNPYTFTADDPINYGDPDGLSWTSNSLARHFSNGAAGFGDAVTGGGTYWIRELIGGNESVDVCSGSYAIGEITGIAAVAVTLGLAAEPAAAEGGSDVPAYSRSQYGRLSPSERAAAIEKSPTCPYCGEAPSTQADHVTSLKQDWTQGGWKDPFEVRTGRVNDPGNLTGACQSCNASKGAKPIGQGPGEWWPPGWGDTWWPLGGP